MEYYIAVQKIFDTLGNVFGYELLFRTSTKRNYFKYHNLDKATVLAITELFYDYHLYNKYLDSTKRIFVNFTGELIKTKIPFLLPNDCVVIELLENIKIDKKLIAFIKHLKKRNYMIAIDDYVDKCDLDKLFPYTDIVKLDFLKNRSLKKRLDIIKYCKDRNIKVLAEKIDSQKEYEFAIKNNCDFFQGFFLHKPQILTPIPVLELDKKFFKLPEIFAEKRFAEFPAG